MPLADFTELGAKVPVPASVGTPQDAGGAHTFKALAADFSEVAGHVGRLADHAAAVEGQRAGLQDGFDPEFRPAGALTIRGEAYDHAGLQVAATKAKAGLTADLASAYDQHGSDPQALGEELKKRTDAWIRGAPEVLRPQLLLEAQHDFLTYSRQAARNVAAETGKAVRAAFDTEVAESVRRIHQRAFLLGNDAAADEVLAKDVGQLDAVLQRRGPDGALLIDPAGAEKVLEGARETVTTARVLGAFDRLGSVGEKQAFIDKLKDDFANSRGLAKNYDLAKFEHLERTLRSEMRAAGTEARAASEGLAHNVTQIEEMAKAGVNVPPDQLAALHSRIISSGHPELIDKFYRAQATAQVLATERNRPPEEIRAMASDLLRRAQAPGGVQPRDLGRLVAINPALTSGSADHSIDGISSGMTVSLTRMLSDMPEDLRRAVMIDEAHRSSAYQAQLRARYENGEIGAAALPGRSRHEVGGAIDLAPAGGWSAKTPEYQAALAWIYANGAKYGIENPAALRGRDPGHFQRAANYREDLSGFKQSELYVHQAKALEDLAGKAERGIKENPLGWAASSGLVKVPPLDLSGADKLTASLKARFVVADQVGAFYGRDPVYLEPTERQKIVQAAAPGGGALLDVVGAISAADPQRARHVFKELWKDGASTLGQVGGLMVDAGQTHPPAVARDVADGVALTRTKDFKSLAPSEKVARNWAIATHGGALDGSPATEQALIDATKYAYDVRLQRKGKVEDPELWKQTYREMAGERQIGGVTFGGFARHNGAQIVIPPDVKQAGFSDLVHAIEPGDFGDNGPRTAQGAASVKELRQARLESVGNGRYYMNLGSQDAPQYLVGKDGRAFVLDLGQLKPQLRQRHPELYVDGGGRPPGMMKLGGPANIDGGGGRSVANPADPPAWRPGLTDADGNPKQPGMDDLRSMPPEEARRVLDEMWARHPSDANGDFIERASRRLGIRPPWEGK